MTLVSTHTFYIVHPTPYLVDIYQSSNQSALEEAASSLSDEVWASAETEEDISSITEQAQIDAINKDDEQIEQASKENEAREKEQPEKEQVQKEMKEAKREKRRGRTKRLKVSDYNVPMSACVLHHN
jgi:biopolymer transport protein ExbB/TolQ